jgi:hypothetical protein
MISFAHLSVFVCGIIQQSWTHGVLLPVVGERCLGVVLAKVSGRWGWNGVFLQVISNEELLVCRCQVQHGS